MIENAGLLVAMSRGELEACAKGRVPKGLQNKCRRGLRKLYQDAERDKLLKAQEQREPWNSLATEWPSVERRPPEEKLSVQQAFGFY